MIMMPVTVGKTKPPKKRRDQKQAPIKLKSFNHGIGNALSTANAAIQY